MVKYRYTDHLDVIGQKVKVVFLDFESYNKSKMTLDNTNGCMNFKTANIYVQIRNWADDELRDFEVEKTLFHEVGHFIEERNTGFTDGEWYAAMFEYAFMYYTPIHNLFKRFKKDYTTHLKSIKTKKK